MTDLFLCELLFKYQYHKYCERHHLLQNFNQTFAGSHWLTVWRKYCGSQCYCSVTNILLNICLCVQLQKLIQGWNNIRVSIITKCFLVNYNFKHSEPNNSNSLPSPPLVENWRQFSSSMECHVEQNGGGSGRRRRSMALNFPLGTHQHSPSVVCPSLSD